MLPQTSPLTSPSNSILKRLLASFRDWAQSLPFGRLLFLAQLDARSFKSRSSYGEDALVNGVIRRHRFLTGKEFSFSYLDIGAFKPIKNSNTYFLYKKGFSGTAVEPNDQLRHLWRGTRPRDEFRSIACGVGKNQKMYFFGPSAESNSLDLEFSEKIKAHQNLKFSEAEVSTETLDQIVEKHKARFPGDYFLDLDIEGMDYSALSEFSFGEDKRPFLILVESFAVDSNQNGGLEGLLRRHEYLLIGRTAISALYADKKNAFTQDLLAAEY